MVIRYNIYLAKKYVHSNVVSYILRSMQQLRSQSCRFCRPCLPAVCHSTLYWLQYLPYYFRSVYIRYVRRSMYVLPGCRNDRTVTTVRDIKKSMAMTVVTKQKKTEVHPSIIYRTYPTPSRCLPAGLVLNTTLSQNKSCVHSKPLDFLSTIKHYYFLL